MQDLLVLTDRLTVGQITFITRVAIQILSYSSLFLLGLIILTHSPRIAPLETHDVLNRVVGKSTVTKTSLKWIAKRLFRRKSDPTPSSWLLLALALSLCYGLFVSLSDIGFIGFRSCAVPGATFQDFPASIKSESDARAVVAANVINGTDPSTVNSYRCDSSSDVSWGVNVTERVCTSWHNSTYGDPSDFRLLNSTDSDILMPKYLQRLNTSRSAVFDLNSFFMSTNGQPVFQPTISGGLAVIPHDSGVYAIVGVPNLSNQQKVDIPKTLALEVDMGCMWVGILGSKDPSGVLDFGKDAMLSDQQYKAQRLTSYHGSAVFQEPLAQAADSVRELMRPWFNASTVDANGYMQSFNNSYGIFSWDTEAQSWFPPSMGNGTISDSVDLTGYITGNCTAQVHQALNVDTSIWTRKSTNQPASACRLYQLRGSFIQNQTTTQGHKEMVCATSTSVNMVSATLEVDVGGNIMSNITHLPSTLNFVVASYFDILHDAPNIGDTSFNGFDFIEHYTLADNATGDLQHFIYQRSAFGATSGFSSGAGSAGTAFSQVGSVMLSVSSLDAPSIATINPAYFSATNFSDVTLTRWGGAVGASFLLSSVGYNGWAGLGSQALTVVSTGGKEATCYSFRYGAAFLPMIVATVAVIFWTLGLLVSARLHAPKKLEGIYGGLSPVIVAPIPGKPPKDSLLVWEKESDGPHLRAIVDGLPIDGGKSDTLATYMKNTKGYNDTLEK
ncbi:hypothetical protein BDZ97DRAFT_1811386 [Flammula alnicola]|nr:hypothetical protein BDZ97DRAFT_1811386 [Flammula alnicola]